MTDQLVLTQPIKQQDPPKPPSTYESQHCVLGAHQGTSIRADNGVIRPACRGTYVYRYTTVVCTCFCHRYFIDDDEDDTALDGVSIRTDDGATAGTVATAPASAPSIAAIPAPRVDARRALYERLLKSPLLADQPRAMAERFILNKEFDVLDMEPIFGVRRQRGELEENVELLCMLWLDGHLSVWPMLDTQTLAVLIDAQDPPSLGAVHAVLTRWSNMLWCETADRPFRFVKFSQRVADLGISEIKRIESRDREARSKGFF